MSAWVTVLSKEKNRAQTDRACSPELLNCDRSAIIVVDAESTGSGRVGKAGEVRRVDLLVLRYGR